jgi:hypothetical protein
MSDQNGRSEFGRRRRRKVIAFIITEALATGVLFLAGSFALLLRPADSTLMLPLNIATIAAAVAMVLIPIIFFAVAPVLPRIDH